VPIEICATGAVGNVCRQIFAGKGLDAASANGAASGRAHRSVLLACQSARLCPCNSITTSPKHWLSPLGALDFDLDAQLPCALKVQSQWESRPHLQRLLEPFEHHMRPAGPKDRGRRAGTDLDRMDRMHAINAGLHIEDVQFDPLRDRSSGRDKLVRF
jgi:hypothetical protein